MNRIDRTPRRPGPRYPIKLAFLLLCAACPVVAVSLRPAAAQSLPPVATKFTFQDGRAKMRIAAGGEAVDQQEQRVAREIAVRCNDKFKLWSFEAAPADDRPVLEAWVNRDGSRWDLAVKLRVLSGEDVDPWRASYLPPGEDEPLGAGWADLAITRFRQGVFEMQGDKIEEALKQHVALAGPAQHLPWQHLSSQSAALPLQREAFRLLTFGRVEMRCLLQNELVMLVSEVLCRQHRHPGPPEYDSLVVRHKEWKRAAEDEFHPVETAPPDFPLEDLRLVEVLLRRRISGLSDSYLSGCAENVPIVPDPEEQ
jgi:hypothetical protein